VSDARRLAGRTNQFVERAPVWPGALSVPDWRAGAPTRLGEIVEETTTATTTNSLPREGTAGKRERPAGGRQDVALATRKCPATHTGRLGEPALEELAICI
jgi:hypothetical protein